MFELGAVPGRVDAYTYSAEDEDFSKNALHLGSLGVRQSEGSFCRGC